jgi:hypothetical protein
MTRPRSQTSGATRDLDLGPLSTPWKRSSQLSYGPAWQTSTGPADRQNNQDVETPTQEASCRRSCEPLSLASRMAEPGRLHLNLSISNDRIEKLEGHTGRISTTWNRLLSGHRA